MQLQFLALKHIYWPVYLIFHWQKWQKFFEALKVFELWQVLFFNELSDLFLQKQLNAWFSLEES